MLSFFISWLLLLLIGVLAEVQSLMPKPTYFLDAYMEWCYLKIDLEVCAAGFDPFLCVACGESPHSGHCDGNFKLYNFLRGQQQDKVGAQLGDTY